MSDDPNTNVVSLSRHRDEQTQASIDKIVHQLEEVIERVRQGKTHSIAFAEVHSDTEDNYGRAWWCLSSSGHISSVAYVVDILKSRIMGG